MNPRNFDDLSNLSMLELFRVEAENQTGVLTGGLLELESRRDGSTPEQLETLMRAAHSLKGAARIVNLQPCVRVAHAMEDCCVAAQQGRLQLRQLEIDVLLRGVDLLAQMSKRSEVDMAAWETDHAGEIKDLLNLLTNLIPGRAAAAAVEAPRPSRKLAPAQRTPPAQTTSPEVFPTQAKTESKPAEAGTPNDKAAPEDRRSPAEAAERVVRMTAENLNRLLGLAGESLVESRWLRPFADSLQRLKRQHGELSQRLDRLRQTFREEDLSRRTEDQINDLCRTLAECQRFLSQRMEELDVFDRRSAHLSHRL